MKCPYCNVPCEALGRATWHCPECNTTGTVNQIREWQIAVDKNKQAHSLLESDAALLARYCTFALTPLQGMRQFDGDTREVLEAALRVEARK